MPRELEHPNKCLNHLKILHGEIDFIELSLLMREVYRRLATYALLDDENSGSDSTTVNQLDYLRRVEDHFMKLHEAQNINQKESQILN